MTMAPCSEVDVVRGSPLPDDIFSYKHFQFENLLQSSTELDLFKTKWFDYREMTPLEATKLYIEAYTGVFRRHFAINMDRSLAEKLTLLEPDEILRRVEQSLEPSDLTGTIRKQRDKRIRKAKSAFTGFWRGRRVADAIGIPYEVYVDLAMTARLNYWDQRHMPNPTQLYSEMVAEKVINKWEELQGSRLYLGALPAYLIQNYAEIRHQDDHHEWLFKQAGIRANPPFFLAQFINDDLLPVEKVRARLDDDTFERVSRHILQ